MKKAILGSVLALSLFGDADGATRLGGGTTTRGGTSVRANAATRAGEANGALQIVPHDGPVVTRGVQRSEAFGTQEVNLDNFREMQAMLASGPDVLFLRKETQGEFVANITRYARSQDGIALVGMGRDMTYPDGTTKAVYKVAPVGGGAAGSDSQAPMSFNENTMRLGVAVADLENLLPCLRTRSVNIRLDAQSAPIQIEFIAAPAVAQASGWSFEEGSSRLRTSRVRPRAGAPFAISLDAFQDAPLGRGTSRTRPGTGAAAGFGSTRGEALFVAADDDSGE